ncbi:AAA family ATPase [Actinoplanes awajinensis]|uniref:Kinase n=1 Tax=Actinoplanes awajinensis subsp. mycoplanecinus TaxID=135947 RepID=A0A101JDH4_9ACTN|nr:AAA family ATPase [Actinoplanes awajinensis]KUL24795.1 hypothetical protein ADL15_41565 [Actinoplanes awajinensis subsp. mycoplanecinus]
MPRLIVLNGPPATGKSTLAGRYAAAHPLTLNLDIDRLRDLIGGWRTDPQAGGLLARAAALAAARVHLLAGHDVIVPQLLARPAFLEQAGALAAETGASFHELVLMDTRENALRRWAVRSAAAAGSPVATGSTVPARFAAERDEVVGLYDRLCDMLVSRPDAQIVHSHENEIDRTYRDVLACLPG